MVIPKLFRWLFFRKKMVQTTFDALRNENTVYLDTSLQLNENQETFAGSRRITHSDIASLTQEFQQDQVFILFGNNKTRTNEIHDMLEKSGFKKVFNVGTLQELKQIKEQLK